MTHALWFYDRGIGVFPTINKVPAVPKGTSWKDYRSTREQAARWREYGVPLGRFAVADSDSPEAEAWNATHLPPTPFKVTTGPYHDGSPGRGRHRFYRHVGDAPPYIYRDGLAIEFKRQGQYVVGPGSVRPDGVVYVADDWSWKADDVPIFPADFVFDDRPLAARGSLNGEPYEFPEAASAGERHDQLFRLLRSCKGRGWDRNDTRQLVTQANKYRCDPPLVEDATFERWFDRAWTLTDRPLDIVPSVSSLERAWLNGR